MFKSLFFAVASIASLVEATARTSPPSGAIVVAKSGGQFTTLQAAVNSISASSTSSFVIFIQPGIYNEQVAVPVLAGKLTIYGNTPDDQDFSKNTVTITQSKGADEAGSNDLSGTLRIKAPNFAAYNLNVINSRGSGIQAIAVSAQGGNQGFYGCKFIGYQDTILANEGVQVYDKCYIEGATDFIFGQRAIAWFEKSTIAISGKGYVTANGRTEASNPSYYVLNGGSIDKKSGVTVADGATFLGRPWRAYSRTVVQNMNLGAVINSAGWVAWGSAQPTTENTFYREFANTGPGAAGTRVSWAGKLTAALKFGDIIGSTSWVDMNYFNGVSVVTSTFVATTTTSSKTTTKSTTAVATTTSAAVTTSKTTTKSTTAVTTSKSITIVSTTLKTTTSAVVVPTTTAGSGGCTVEKWGKCGGSGYTGCTACVAGSVCTFSNDFYSQCL